MSYHVVYRSGGTHHCTWRKISEQYHTAKEANAERDKLQAMGYAAMTLTAQNLKVSGIPVGWHPSYVDWEHDEITETPYETVHIKRS